MIINKVKDTIRSYDLIRAKDRIIVGVSGGPDSIALLCILHSLSKEMDFSLYVAHLDHMLRVDSGKDADFTRAIAKKLNIAVYSKKLNIKKDLARSGSLEEVARNARFNYFFSLAKKISANKIALGHNLDDQAETILMRIIRGSGLNGLSGIMPKRDIGGFTVIRPLIEVKRNQIEAFLKKKRIIPRRDITNSKNIYFRNKMRNILIPYLEKGYNKNIKEILANMAATIAYDYDYLSSHAEKIKRRLGKKISLNKLGKLHPAMQRMVFRYAIADLKGDYRRISFKHIREIEDLLINRPLGSVVDLPSGISALKNKYLIFYRRK